MKTLEVKNLKKKITKLTFENTKLKKTIESYKTQNDLLKSSYDVLQESFVNGNEEIETGREKDLRLRNDMLNMEIITYKLQIESL